ncbi:hypothetical protein WKK05_02860 [Nostoc sp. UHCC 0302]|uniref:hypothetical protein n=1 Tax=Nostoc sp. UHCC 0302 TaxID=3134896 RepID=UPI00311C969E
MGYFQSKGRGQKVGRRVKQENSINVITTREPGVIVKLAITAGDCCKKVKSNNKLFYCCYGGEVLNFAEADPGDRSIKTR